MQTKLIVPKEIKHQKGAITNIGGLLLQKDSQIGLSETNYTSVKGKGFIALDFANEICGGVQISTYLIKDKPYARIRIRFGESLSETYAELGEKGACNDHSLRDFETRLVSLSTMNFGQTGFRFIRIDFLDDVEISIKSICALSQCHTLQPVWQYGGGDSEMAQIFTAAKRTIDLCMQEYIWDGIKRDRLVWIGDMHPEMLAVCALYGRQPVVEKSLDFVKGQTPLPQWMNNFPTYSLWWIIILADYYKLTGCLDYLNGNIEYLNGLVRQVLAHIDEGGGINFPFFFVDWPTHKQYDEEEGVRAITAIALKRVLELSKTVKLDIGGIEKAVENLKKKSIQVKSAKQVIALKFLAYGEINQAEKDMLIEGGAKGMSTFMSCYILQAVLENFGKEKAVEMLKEYYGAMIEKGATTFWEDFDLSWVEGSGSIDELPKEGFKDIHGDFGDFCYKGFRHSLCHGWSSGILYFIKEHCG